jgi:hypothetical protein
MSETEAVAVDSSVIEALNNVLATLKSAAVSTKLGSPEFVHLKKTSQAVEKAMESYQAGPKERKSNGRRGRPPKDATATEE